MSNQKIAGILIPMATSREVLKEFARYIKEAHPDNAAHLTALVKYVMKKGEQLEDSDFEKETVFQLLFPNETYKPSRMKEIYAKAIKMAEGFLINRALQKRDYLRNFLLAESMDDLQLERHARKKLDKTLNDLPNEEEEHFAIGEKAYRHIYFQPEKNLKEKKKKRPYLIKGYKANKIRYIIGDLKYCCELIERKILLGEPYEEGIEALITDSLSNIKFRDEVPLIDILARSAFFLQAPTLEKYYDLKERFFNSLDVLYSREILLYLLNSLIFLHIDNRHLEYFELYKLGVENGYFIEKGQISPVVFNNTVRIACQSNQMKWAEQFIQNHIQYLNKPKELMENIRTLYNCFLLFAQKDHLEVLKMLDDLHFEDYSYGLNKYNLQVKAIYEVHKHRGKEQMIKQVNNYKDYVNDKVDRQYISIELKIRVFNFLNTLAKIMAYPYKKYSKESILERLHAYKGKVIDKKWLEEKIKQLK